MATASENLTTARNNLAAKLAEISASPKPSYSVDGQSVSWTEYYDFLVGAIDRLNSSIAANDPYEIHTTGFSP